MLIEAPPRSSAIVHAWRAWPLVGVVVVVLAGRFSITEGGWLATATAPRYWGAAVLSLVLLAVRLDPRRARLGRQARGLVLATYALMMYLAVSSGWSYGGGLQPDIIADLLLVAVLVHLFCAFLAERLATGTMVLLRFLEVVACTYLVGGLLGVGHTNINRVSAFSSGPNVFVRVMAMGAVAAAFLYLSTGRLRHLAVIPLLTLGAVLSGSRGGLIALVVAGALCTYFIVRRLSPHRTTVALVLMAMFGAAVLFVYRDEVVSTITFRVVELSIEQRYVSGRSILFRTAIDLFESAPVFGAGLGSFSVVTPSPTNLYPHNIFLGLAAEGGIVALGLFGWTVAQGFRRRTPPARGVAVAREAFVCLFVVQLVASQFSGDTYDARFAFIFLGALACTARASAEARAR